MIILDIHGMCPEGCSFSSASSVSTSMQLAKKISSKLSMMKMCMCLCIYSNGRNGKDIQNWNSPERGKKKTEGWHRQMRVVL